MKNQRKLLDSMRIGGIGSLHTVLALLVAVFVTKTSVAAPLQVTWKATLTNSIQTAVSGSTVQFAGKIDNFEAVPLAIRNVGLFFDTDPPTTNWQAAFATDFLGTSLLIPPSGYAGPLFEVTLPSTLPATFFAGGSLEVMLEPVQAFGEITPSEPDHPVVIAVPFAINQPPLLISTTTGGTVLSWPASARGFVLQSASSLAPPTIWNRVTDPPLRYGEHFRLTTPLSGQNRYFRLALP